MNQHGLIKLLAATAAVVGLAFWVNVGRNPEPSGDSNGGPLVPGMKAAINDVQTLRVVGPGEKILVTLNRAEKNWTVAERSGYPADIEKVREYLLRLADSSLLEAKTSTESLYAKLGVEDVKAAEAKGARVELDGLKAPIRLVIGNYNGQAGGGTFVRRNDEAQTWLAKGTLIPEKQAVNWLQKALADVPSSRIKRVEIVQSGSNLVAHKQTPADANFQIDSVPKGRQLKSAFEGNALAGVLSGLRFDDVRKSEDFPIDAGNALVQARFVAFDGLVIAASSRSDGEKMWVQFVASFDAALADAQIKLEQEQAATDFEAATRAHSEALAAKAPAGEADADADADAEAAPEAPVKPLALSDPEKYRSERIQKIEQEVAGLNTRFSGWLFQLAPYTYSNMSRKLEDLLEPTRIES
jgi:hypothetical protein